MAVITLSVHFHFHSLSLCSADSPPVSVSVLFTVPHTAALAFLRPCFLLLPPFPNKGKKILNALFGAHMRSSSASTQGKMKNEDTLFQTPQIMKHETPILFDPQTRKKQKKLHTESPLTPLFDGLRDGRLRSSHGPAAFLNFRDGIVA